MNPEEAKHGLLVKLNNNMFNWDESDKHGWEFYFTDKTSLPRHCLRDAIGELVSENNQWLVWWPVVNKYADFNLYYLIKVNP